MDGADFFLFILQLHMAHFLQLNDLQCMSWSYVGYAVRLGYSVGFLSPHISRIQSLTDSFATFPLADRITWVTTPFLFEGIC